MMTEIAAKLEAEKRERHKSKHMRHKRWAAVHDSVKGWHVALVDVARAVEPPSDADLAFILVRAILAAALQEPGK